MGSVITSVAMALFGQMFWENGEKTAQNTEENRSTQSKLPRFLTQILDGEVALLVVHLDGLSVGAADAVADGVTAHDDVLVLGRRPTHHDAVDQRADVERAGLVRDAGFW